MGNPLQRFWQFISTSNYQRTFSILVLLIMVAAVPLTVYVARTRQELRQRASTEYPATIPESSCINGTYFTPQQIGSDISGNVASGKMTWEQEAALWRWKTIGCTTKCSKNEDCQPNTDQNNWIARDTSNWCYGFVTVPGDPTKDVGHCIQLRFVGPGGDQVAAAPTATSTQPPPPTNPPPPRETPTATPASTVFDCKNTSGYGCYVDTCPTNYVPDPDTKNHPKTNCESNLGQICCTYSPTETPSASPSATATPIPASVGPAGAIQEYKITLSKGWNLISVPRALVNPSITAIDGKGEFINRVYYYNTGKAKWEISVLENGKWTKHIGGENQQLTNEVPTINEGKGYWVHAPEEGVLNLQLVPEGTAAPSSFKLLPGWNQIGFVSRDLTHSVGISTYLGSVSGKWIRLWSYDPKDGSWRVAAPAPSRDVLQSGYRQFESFELGRGYFLYVDGNWELYP